MLGMLNSVEYEITFFALKPASIAKSPITLNSLDLLTKSNMFINYFMEREWRDSSIDINKNS